VRPAVGKLSKTCHACPAQWEGETVDGRFIYVRYRWGCLTAGIGTNIEAAVDASGNLFSEIIGYEYDADMTTAEMCRLLRQVVDFSQLGA